MNAIIDLGFAAALLLIGLDCAHEGVSITGRVFYGNESQFDPERGDPVGTIRSKDVYLHIAPYIELMEKGIDKESARGKQLIREATKVFKREVNKVAQVTHSALIVEEGGIRGYPVRDLTPLVIKNLVAQLKAG